MKIKAKDAQPGQFYSHEGRWLLHVAVQYPRGSQFADEYGNILEFDHKAEVEHLEGCKGWRGIRRIPGYRSFASGDDFRPYRDKWLRFRGCDEIFRVETYTDSMFWHGGGGQGTFFDAALADYEFDDGTPFGVPELQVQESASRPEAA